jgi:murein DD-endopeptidase MepM/ murein hydrolase activator NlpD
MDVRLPHSECRAWRLPQREIVKALLPVIVVLALGAAAVASPGVHHRARRARKPSRPSSPTVRPSPEIEERVAYEAGMARQIVDTMHMANLLASPYLVEAMYYHDGLLAGFPVDSPTADPDRRIVGQICRKIGPAQKERFVSLLHTVWAGSDPPGPDVEVLPLANPRIVTGARTHQDAIDLFAPEGSPVYALSRGIVVLAETGWSGDNVFSTSSGKGGNTVIVFVPDHDRFYRFCHLSTVLVSPGDLVAAGQVVGRVGHTGRNASRWGHGQHLHFEMNEYAGGRVRVIGQRRLRTILLSLQPPGR